MLTNSLIRSKNNKAIYFSTPKRWKASAKTLIGAWLGVLMVCATSSVYAENTNLYAGLGITNTKASEQGINSTKAGVRFTGGYQFNKYFASELGLFSTGNHDNLGMKGDGVSLSVLGQYPIVKRLSVFAELGGVLVEQKIDENNTTVDPTGKRSMQDGKDPGFFYAYGISYGIQDWTFAFKVSEVDTDADLSIMSLNLYRHF